MLQLEIRYNYPGEIIQEGLASDREERPEENSMIVRDGRAMEELRHTYGTIVLPDNLPIN